MNDYEQLLIDIEFLENDIALLQEELGDKMAIKLHMEEQAVEETSIHWFDDGDDPYKGRLNKFVEKYKAMLAGGSRAERFLMNTLPVFNCKIVTTLAEREEDIEPEIMELYVKEQTENFVNAMVGGLGKKGYMLDGINTPEGELSGYRMPWAGNFGPIGGRKRFESFWADPKRGDALKTQAVREMAYRDRQFARYNMMRGGQAYLDRFWKRYPFYEIVE